MYSVYYESRVQQLYREHKRKWVIHFQKKAEDIKGLFLKALRMKSLSFAENAELA